MSELNSNPNRGKPIYYNNELHYIVHEMNEITLISKSKSLDVGVFCVKKNKLKVRPKNN